MRKYEVVMTSWFGDYSTIKSNLTEEEAKTLARQCNKESRAIDNPQDKVKYIVESYEETSYGSK